LDERIKDLTGNRRKLHNEEFHDLYSSPNIIWVIKPRIRRAEYKARRGGGGGERGVGGGKGGKEGDLEGRSNWGGQRGKGGGV